MEKSKKYGFYLPSRDTDDIADINLISDNFRIIDEEMASVSFDEGTEIVFIGGNAEASSEVDLVVDGELSQISTNAIQNKAVAKAILEVKDDMSQEVETAKKDIIDGAHPVGSLYWTSELNNPSNVLGGTWEMIDKEFAPVELYDAGLTINPDVVNRGSVEARLAGHTVEITVGMVNAVEIGDTNDIVWGTLTPSSFGCSEFSQTVSLLSLNDGGNGSVMFTVSNGGTIMSGDTIGSRPLPASDTDNSFTVIFTQMPHLMLDEFCNKFCWKRIE